MASPSSHRQLAALCLAAGGVASLVLGAALTGLVARYASSDGVVEARTGALLWTVRVRLIFMGAGGLLAAWAVGSASLRDRLRRLNAHPGSWGIFAGLIFGYAVIGVYVDPYLVSDLRPTPDAAEYAVSARRLMVAGSYTLPVGEAVWPPRYLFGYPLLIVPFYGLFGPALSHAVLCSLTLVGLTAALAYRTGERVWGRTAGVASGLLTLSSRTAIDAGRSVMSESAAMLAMTLAAWLLVRLMERRRAAWMWGLLGICIGAGATVRFTNALLLGPAALVLLWKGRNRDGQDVQDRPLLAVACLCGGCGLALLPVLIYQAETFGGLLRTGYAFWVPYYYEASGHTFNLRYAFQSPALGEVTGLPNALFYGGLLAGWGRSCYALPTAAFVVIGAVVALGQSEKSRVTGPLRSAPDDESIPGRVRPGDDGGDVPVLRALFLRGAAVPGPGHPPADAAGGLRRRGCGGPSPFRMAAETDRALEPPLPVGHRRGSDRRGGGGRGLGPPQV
ncbi:MAG: phospholipid carrier-dependent glycosyltransferase [Candidatus Latescibacteria bacterium]|nr:phospholipid carrier-dependent glycosyltransferase [Candidatus Latescibacterota bacterium]